MKTLVINKQEVSELLTMEACIELMSTTFKNFSAGNAIQPLRNALWLPDKSGLLGMMPAYTGDKGNLGIKVVSVFPDNHAKGLSSHQGVVLLFESNTGEMYAILDGDRVTAIRTAAASAVATDALASEAAETLAILGSGEQALRHLEAMLQVRNITSVKIWSRNEEHARAFTDQVNEIYEITAEAIASGDEAVHGADLICTTTSSKGPVLSSKWVKDGAHINAVGACTSNARELESALVARTKLYCDCRESLVNESGDYLMPLGEGLFDETHLKGEIGELLNGDVPGRESEEEITLFKSLGMAVEDLSACHYIYEKAKEHNLGTEIEL